MKDPIVGEVRKIRETLAAECGFDLHRIALRQKRVGERWKGKKVSYDDLVSKRRPAAVAEGRREYGRNGS
jgi:hypothetical protein